MGHRRYLTGVLAIRDMKRNPHRHGMDRTIFGLISGALFTILWAIGLGVMLTHGI
jgi:hypothetical protein